MNDVHLFSGSQETPSYDSPSLWNEPHMYDGSHINMATPPQSEYAYSSSYTPMPTTPRPNKRLTDAAPRSEPKRSRSKCSSRRTDQYGLPSSLSVRRSERSSCRSQANSPGKPVPLERTPSSSSFSSRQYHDRSFSPPFNPNSSTCHKCHKTFTRPRDAQRHIKEIHNKNIVVRCEPGNECGCGKGFRRKEHLASHLRTVIKNQRKRQQMTG